MVTSSFNGFKGITFCDAYLKGALGWYLSEVADFSQVFFAFATLIVLVVSLYYAAVIFVLGGEVAKVYGQRSVMRRQRVMFDQE